MAILELLGGAALEQILGGGIAAVRRFFNQTPRGRLLTLLHAEFGEESGLERDVILDWPKYNELSQPLDDLLAGRRQPDDALAAELAGAIELRLFRTPEADRAELAARIGQAAVSAYPLAIKDFPEFSALLITKVDTAQAESREQHSAILNKLTELRSERDDASAALLAGPLRHTGQEEALARAEDLVSAGKTEEAAAAFVEVARGLESGGLDVVAESYRLRAADLLVAASLSARAIALIEDVIWRHVARGDSGIGVILYALEQSGAESWLVDAYRAAAEWPEYAEARDALRTAAKRDPHPRRAQRWRALACEIELLIGEPGPVLADSDGLGPLEAGPRLAIALDRITALDDANRPDDADAAWREVVAWLEASGSAEERGLCWSRRGLAMALRGDVDGTRQAYEEAMRAYGGADSAAGLVADCLLSMQAAQLMLQEPVSDPNARALAASIRHAPGTPGATAQLLQQRAAAYRINAQLPDGLRDYWLALALYHRHGDLGGLLEVAPMLAELYVAAGRDAAALALYVSCGQSKKASALAEKLSSDQIDVVLSEQGAPWQRAAAYAALSAAGTRVSPGLAERFAAGLMVDAAVDPPHLMKAHLAASAKRALAAIYFALPAGDLQTAAEGQLRHDVLNTALLEPAGAAALTLTRATDLGITDARDLLIGPYLEGRPLADIDSRWVADQIKDAGPWRDQVLAAARGDSEPALEAVAVAQLDVADDRALTEAAGRLVEKFAQITTIEANPEEGSVTHHIGVRFALPGMVAGLASPESRTLLRDRLVQIATDERDSEATRLSAVQGLFNLARSLTPEELVELSAVAAPLAEGKYAGIDLDHDITDPLSRFQMKFNARGSLRPGALSLLARLVELGAGEALPALQRSVNAAFEAGEEGLLTVALDALVRVPECEAPIGLAAGLTSASSDIRRATLKVLWWRDRDAVAPLLPALLVDDSWVMRSLILSLATETGDEMIVRHVAEHDPDSYMRAFAASVLAGMGGD